MAEEVKGSVVESTVEETGDGTAKTYTEAQVQEMLQAETDRRISSARKKWEKEKSEAVLESEKLQKMDESQRREYEFSQKLQELEGREKEFNINQNKLEATKVLANRGLPIGFVDYIVAEDAETMMSNITSFEAQWKTAIADAVASKIAQPAPKAGSVKQTGLTREEFKKLNINQQSEIYRTNPELYNALSKN